MTVWRGLKYTIWVVLLLLLLMLSLLSLAMKYTVVHTLEQRGYQVELNYVSLEPGVGRFLLHDLIITGVEGKQIVLQQLLLDIKLLPLLSQKIDIQAAEIKGLHLDVGLVDGDILLAGIPLDKPAQDQNIPPPAAVSSASDLPAPIWQLSLNQLQIEDIHGCLTLTAAADTAHYCGGFASLALSSPLLMQLTPTISLAQTGTLMLRGLKFVDELHNFGIVQVGDLSVTEWQWQNGVLDLGQLLLRQTALLERSEQKAYFPQFDVQARLPLIQLDKLQWQPTALSLERILLSDWQIFMHRQSDTRLALMSRLEQLQFPLAETGATSDDQLVAQSGRQLDDAGATAPVTPLHIRIGEFALENAQLVWVDESVNPVVQEHLTGISLHAKGIDNKGQEPITVNFIAHQGSAGTVILGGNVKPFGQAISLTLDTKIQALDLVPLSGYTEQMIGYKIQRGQLQADISTRLEGNELDVKNDFRFNKFYLHSLKPQTENTAEASGKPSMLPIGTAMNLLRDSEDNIFLKLPVTGDVNDPNLSLGHVIGVVGRKALTEAVISYYTPFGAVKLVQAIGSAALSVRFDPLQFAPGEVGLTPLHHESLNKMLELLKVKPKLAMSFCAYATGPDWLQLAGRSSWPDVQPALTPEQKTSMMKLARERSVQIQTYLLQQGAGPEQVILCNPDILPGSQKMPYVEILL